LYQLHLIGAGIQLGGKLQPVGQVAFGRLFDRIKFIGEETRLVVIKEQVPGRLPCKDIGGKRNYGFFQQQMATLQFFMQYLNPGIGFFGHFAARFAENKNAVRHKNCNTQ